MTSRIIRAGFWLIATTAISLTASFGPGGTAEQLRPLLCRGPGRRDDRAKPKSPSELPDRPGAGHYQLVFKYPINNCAITATLDNLPVLSTAKEYLIAHDTHPMRS